MTDFLLLLLLSRIMPTRPQPFPALVRPLTISNPSGLLDLLLQIHKTYFEDRPIPELGPKDVLIEIAKTGTAGLPSSSCHLLGSSD
jgi:hypothetical protein